MTLLEPIKYLETLSGKAAHLLLFNDGNRYAVKCKNNFHGTRELVNEFVIARLGQHLSLPALPEALIEEVIREIPSNWSVPMQDREALVTYLILRKKTFADSVYQFAKKYGRGSAAAF
ncbi:hypothetical protein [Paenibacillus guangzhouensis]|uniref:hypothetical protein n=1 Tax=Paenibacillus guangzhouensis TaxID=1473112 RepID=UPI001266FAAE|nr:hypothetical protein [Paenibacillus guangzhouensis]